MSQEEKSSGRKVFGITNFWLKFFIDEVNNLDIGFSGNTFNWCNKNGRFANIQEQLDRVITSVEWRTTFGNAGVTHLTAYHSDHAPIVLNMFLNQPKLPRPFRFQKI